MQQKRVYKRDSQGNFLDEEGRVLSKVTGYTDGKRLLSKGEVSLRIQNGGDPQEVLNSLKRTFLVDEGGTVRKPVLLGVKILRLPENGVQRFSPNILQVGAAEGWLKVEDGSIIIDGVNFKITKTPGYFCCHCDEPLDSSKASKTHVSLNHEGVASPDSNNPSGYSKNNYYETTFEKEPVSG